MSSRTAASATMALATEFVTDSVREKVKKIITPSRSCFLNGGPRLYNAIIDNKSHIIKDDVDFMVSILKACALGKTCSEPERVLRSTSMRLSARNVMLTLSGTVVEHCDTICDHGGFQAMVALTAFEPSKAMVASYVLGKIVSHDYFMSSSCSSMCKLAWNTESTRRRIRASPHCNCCVDNDFIGRNR